jgi:2-oxoisovalerate dehydrogenase E1 component
MGVYWAKNAAKNLPGQISVIDLRTLIPWDETLVFNTVKAHGLCLVVTEESVGMTYAQALAGKIQSACFKFLDAPVELIGAENLPAIPLNSTLEAAMLPNAQKVEAKLRDVLGY